MPANVEMGAVAGVGPTLAAAPAIEISSIVNEGPVGPGFKLENTMPHTIGSFKPLGEITFSDPDYTPGESVIPSSFIKAFESPSFKEDFQASIMDPMPVEMPQTAPLSTEAVVDEAFHWLGMDQTKFESDTEVEPTVMAENPGVNLAPRVNMQPSFIATAESTNTNQQPEVWLATTFKEIEEVVEEKRLVKEERDQSERIEEGEEVVRDIKAYVVDQPVLTQVLFETDQAVRKAEDEAEKLGLGKKLLGYLIAKFIPSQNEGNTGGAVKPYGLDGTILARREGIAGVKEFSSKHQVKTVILENRPVTIGQEGERSSENEVRTTFKDWVVKPAKLVEIVEKRIVKRRVIIDSLPKTVVGFGGEIVKPKTENNLEDLGLQEVFASKAA